MGRAESNHVIIPCTKSLLPFLDFINYLHTSIWGLFEEKSIQTLKGLLHGGGTYRLKLFVCVGKFGVKGANLEFLPTR